MRKNWLILKIISHCDVKHILTSSIKTITPILKVLTYVITSITARSVGHAAILTIMSVSTFKTAVILYIADKFIEGDEKYHHITEYGMLSKCFMICYCFHFSVTFRTKIYVYHSMYTHSSDMFDFSTFNIQKIYTNIFLIIFHQIHL